MSTYSIKRRNITNNENFFGLEMYYLTTQLDASFLFHQMFLGFLAMIHPFPL